MWNFYKHIEGRPERDPQELEFFHTASGWCEPLVREVIQNSLDAVTSDSDKLTINFKIMDAPKEIKDLTENLLPHYNACYDNIKSNELKQSKVLIIEDFGTTGLDGDISRTTSKDFDSNFYKFWWAEGSSFKQGKSRGRWGLGKTVLHGASKVRAFWGFTQRADSKKYLMGKAIFRNHSFESKRYDYNGYFATWKKDRKYPEFLTATPVSNKKTLKAFNDVFQLDRDGKPGLSLVIPYIKDDITFNDIIKYSIDNYFFPLMNDDLEIHVKEKNKSEKINQRTIKNLSIKYEAKIGKSDLTDQLNFLETVRDFDKDNIIELSSEKTDIKFDKPNNEKEKIKKRFADGELLAFRIFTKIKPSNSKLRQTFFDVFLHKDQKLKKPEEFYIRSGIIINDIRMLKSPVRALLLAEDDMVSRFLGDAETPSHTNWLENTKDFKERYANAPTTLRLIKNSIPKIVKMIDTPPAGRNSALLSGVFPKITTEPINPLDNHNEDGGEVKVKPKRTKSDFRIRQINDGFYIDIKNNGIVLPCQAEVMVAYDVAEGNPFEKWKLFDFSFKEVNIKGKGTRENKYTILNNKLSFEIVEPDFNIKITGFDIKRDLIVNISVKDEEKD
jgi:hypothetical protein